MPETRYARSDGVSIAYQVIGDGPRDLVYVPGWISNVEVMWEDPTLARFLRRLAAFSRLITFDKRGTGLSDPVPTDQLPTLEVRMDDVRAVMDSVGSETATLFGHSEGGNMCLLFAATYPERTDGLVLTGSYVKRIASEDYPWAPTWEERLQAIEATEQTWPDPIKVEVLAPSRAGDPAFRTWMARYARLSASPRAAAAFLRMNSQIDVTSILPAIRVPTLLLYRVDDTDVHIDEGRYIASKIPEARLVELSGADHFFWAGDTEALLAEIEEFVTGHRHSPQADRVLATVLLTDIVSSTQTASALGDRAWTDRLERHNAVVRAELTRWRGREVNTTGDGFVATFDGPARAINCARAVTEAVKPLELEVRCGLHTGEVEVVGDDVAGVAVHIAARIAAEAGPGEVMVSRTVKDLVAGGGFQFQSDGTRSLKGIPDEWELFRVGTSR
ncbi:MAG TPA: adenylate/guanylate cyclase domain-containing protein [Acidimicrobiia bacterium]|nr:adenylate/guanylate cyclase domain-containing protein [Acidimicrobiia bacterium]